MELLPLAFTSGWTSGINAYATVLILGLLGRFAGIEEIPAGLQRTDVLIASAVLAVIEFVADKVPYVYLCLTIALMARVRPGWRAFRRWMQPA